MSIKLGSKVRDRVTGLEGIATARIEYLNGCVQYGVRPPVGADGKFPDAIYLDVETLEVVGLGIEVQSRPGGGPPGAGIPGSYR